MAKKYSKVGAIKLSKGGEGKVSKLYINLNADKDKEGKVNIASIKALHAALGSLIDNPNDGDNQYGVSLMIEKPQDSLRRLNELGYIDDDKLEARIEGVPDWLKYEITLVHE
jgi:hypothetical protein